MHSVPLPSAGVYNARHSDLLRPRRSHLGLGFQVQDIQTPDLASETQVRDLFSGGGGILHDLCGFLPFGGLA